MDYRKYRYTLFLFSLIFILLLVSQSQIEAVISINVRHSVSRWFNLDDRFLAVELDRENLYAEELMAEFYHQRGYRPVWVNEEGVLPAGSELISLLTASEDHGLFPEEYHLSLIGYNLMSVRSFEPETRQSIRLLTEIELLLTDAFFIYASDLYQGRLDQENLQRNGILSSDKLNLISLLNQGLEQFNLGKALENIRYLPDEYHVLREKLAQYRQIQQEGGWPQIDDDQQVLRLDDQGPQVKLLRKRLRKEPGINDELDIESDLFDEEVRQALFNFQQRYGQTLTGVAGYSILKLLNKPVESIIDKLIINLERMRWVDIEPDRPQILINIPSFKMRIYEDRQIVREERTVVGTRYRPTPSFSTHLTRLVLNPRWYMPRSIAVQDYLPKVKQDLSYLQEKNIRVYERNSTDFSEVNPREVEWEEMTAEEFDLYFWQDSGPDNALGGVIFQSPAYRHIYMHDTPDKHLFSLHVRAFSSGCVRVQNALEIAEYLILNYSDIEKEEIGEIKESGKETPVSFSQRLPIHYLYLTAWASANGNIRLYNDIYEKDKQLIEKYFEI